MKFSGGTFTLLFLCASLSAQKKMAEKLPQHQLVPFYTNAVTGITKNPYHYSEVEPRYGLNFGLDYNVKLVKWFSIGTGLGFILHRSYTSFVSDSLTRPSAPSNIWHVKSSERIQTRGIIDLPLRIIFTVVKRRNLEFQLQTGISMQTIIYERSHGFVDYYGGEQPYNHKDSFDGFGAATRLGFVISPILKVGRKNGLAIEPEFRLIQLERKVCKECKESRMYSAGLKMGWFFYL